MTDYSFRKRLARVQRKHSEGRLEHGAILLPDDDAVAPPITAAECRSLAGSAIGSAVAFSVAREGIAVKPFRNRVGTAIAAK
jgi:hypothetical protein